MDKLPLTLFKKKRDPERPHIASYKEMIGIDTFIKFGWRNKRKDRSFKIQTPKLLSSGQNTIKLLKQILNGNAKTTNSTSTSKRTIVIFSFSHQTDITNWINSRWYMIWPWTNKKQCIKWFEHSSRLDCDWFYPLHWQSVSRRSINVLGYGIVKFTIWSHITWHSMCKSLHYFEMFL